MKSTKLLLLAVVAAVSAIPAIGQAKSPDEAKIEALVAAEAAAINAKDVSAIMQAYVTDESLIVFHYPAAPICRCQGFSRGLAGLRGPIRWAGTVRSHRPAR